MRMRTRQCCRLLIVPLLLALTAAVFLPVPSQAAVPSTRSAPSDASHALSLATITVLPAGPGGGARTFTIVLLAETKEERVKGLQGFRALMPREAALFVFDPPQDVSFWMANLTYAIDIIYVDAAGTVTEVFSGCQPESREVYSSGGQVRWVIETVAGSGVRQGDRIQFE